MERITGADALFLELETPTMHMHVVGVLVLDHSHAPGWKSESIIETLSERIHLIPPFRRRVLNVPAGLDHPRWVDDTEFSLDRHVRRHVLDSPGDASQFAEFVGKVSSVNLPRDRPLWEMWIVEGRDDGTVAIVSKVHHAVMDGAAGGELMASLFDLTPEGEPVDPPAVEWDPAETPASSAVVIDAMGAAVSRAGRLPGTVVRSAQRLACIARTKVSKHNVEDAPPLMAPKSPFNGPLTARRGVSFEQCSLDDMRRARAAFGTTVNDVVLAAASTALRGYLSRRDMLPDGPLVASVPMSVRTGEDTGDIANQIVNLMVPLPVHLDDPIGRLVEVGRRTREAKATASPVGPDLVAEWVDLTAVATVRTAALAYSGLGLNALHPPVFNLILSNIPGPPIPLYLAGASVVATYPMGPLIANTGLNLTVLSQMDDVFVGIMCCPDLVEDVDEIAAGFVAGVTELAQLAAKVKPPTP